MSAPPPSLPWPRGGSGVDIASGCNHSSCEDPTPRGGSFEICQACYTSGKTCTDPSHPLTLYLAYRKAQGVLTVYDTREVSCDRCKKAITDPVCYHCKKCAGGNFDICSDCYSTGSGCGNPKHSLLKLLLLDKASSSLKPSGTA